MAKEAHEYSGVRYNLHSLAATIAGDAKELIRSFSWSTTPEGYGYWDKVYDKKKISLAVRAKLISIRNNGIRNY